MWSRSDERVSISRLAGTPRCGASETMINVQSPASAACSNRLPARLRGGGSMRTMRGRAPQRASCSAHHVARPAPDRTTSRCSSATPVSPGGWSVPTGSIIATARPERLSRPREGRTRRRRPEPTRPRMTASPGRGQPRVWMSSDGTPVGSRTDGALMGATRWRWALNCANTSPCCTAVDAIH